MTAWFPRVIGHEAAKDSLRRALEGERLEGSFIFCGPAGIGRALLAREVAMAVNCRGTDAAERPCRGCGPCRRIEKEIHGDYMVIRRGGKQSIGIDQVHGMLEELVLAPVEAERRVFVIDPAGELSEPAQNALLKGLEEPPPRALIVLVTEREEELLSTIVSRCAVIRFSELTPPQVAEVLRREGVEAQDAAARARWCGGSPGKALAEDALEVSELATHVVEVLTSGRAYKNPVETVETLAKFVGTGKGGDLGTQRDRIRTIMGFLQRALRDALLARDGVTQEHTPRLSGANDALLGRLRSLPRGRLENAIDRLAQLEDELSRNVNTKFLLDGLVLDLGSALAPPRELSVR